MKKKNVKKSRSKGITPKRHYVIIDFPLDNEVICNNDYTVKVGASVGDIVEVCIDGGGWMSCRAAEGFWWYDWNDYIEGFHKVEARLRKNNRTLKNSISKNCKYEPM
ncbi:hypothetical protein KAI68_00675 [bacterium]|nr:hypothetical protein [bacterium]